jgi:hypothetical protein
LDICSYDVNWSSYPLTKLISVYIQVYYKFWSVGGIKTNKVEEKSFINLWNSLAKPIYNDRSQTKRILASGLRQIHYCRSMRMMSKNFLTLSKRAKDRLIVAALCLMRWVVSICACGRYWSHFLYCTLKKKIVKSSSRLTQIGKY